jgi:hypothetical protein
VGADSRGSRWSSGRFGVWQIERHDSGCGLARVNLNFHRQPEHRHRASVMKAFLIVLSMTPFAMWAQSAIAPPRIGFIQDSTHSLRPVYGLAGNFVLGDAAVANIEAASFSGSFGILKDSSTLTVIDGQGRLVASQDAPLGPALFAFSRTGAPALAYFTGTNVLLRWGQGAFQQVSLDHQTFVSARVLSIAAVHRSQAAFIVQRDDALWDIRILLSSGEVISQTALLGITSAALMLATGDLIYGDANGIVVRRPDGSEKHIDALLPPAFVFQQMGDGWIQIRDLTTEQQYAVRLTGGKEQFYALPGVDR